MIANRDSARNTCRRRAHDAIPDFPVDAGCCLGSLRATQAAQYVAIYNPVLDSVDDQERRGLAGGGTMIDREKVIAGLESLYVRLLDAAARDKIAMLDAMMVSDALALLKAQEPRVMTWQEVIGAVIGCKPIYIEMKDIDYEEPGGNRWVMVTQYGDSLTNGMICAMSSYITRETLFKDWYNKTWRCWTSKPSLKQMEETPWK